MRRQAHISQDDHRSVSDVQDTKLYHDHAVHWLVQRLLLLVLKQP